MFYPDNFEQKIGFDKVRNLIKEKCISSLGKEKTNSLAFETNPEKIVFHLSETEEMQRILTQEQEDFPLSNILDLRESLTRIRVEGLYLDAAELDNLRHSLRTANAINEYMKNREDDSYPTLMLLMQDVMLFPAVISQIDSILNKFGKIKDNASPELQRIRRELFQTQSGISHTLQIILRQAQANGLVEKDAQATMREGRLVIPVSPAYKRKLKGIVHDESASGKTVFIEPTEVVESNNRLRELESEEQREIIRILVEFANYLRPYLEDILSSYSFLGTMDFIRAKALFSIDINAIKPTVENRCEIEWNKALHPLLFLSLKKQEKEIVPLNILLNDQQRLLLISGPNAGGKSVCLKTVGLLQYMMQCGLLVSVHENSRMGIFERIFLDIGDEQSIENDLSTYSSHLTNMKFFVRNSQKKTLLLIDEFGGGTEPMIGGAIAESLLANFNDNKAFGVITTHYTNLKHFAEDAEGIINGAMLYDRHNMQPLFQLEIGNPGSSFAIEIARKIGLPETVIQQAIEKVGVEHINYDKHLQDIVRDKRYWESKRQQIRQREKRIEELEIKYENELKTINSQRKEIINKAKADANAILANTNAKIENTIREIKESQAEKERTKTARLNIEKFKESLSLSDENDAVTARMQKIKEKQARRNQQKENKSKLEKTFDSEKLKVGDNVKIKGQNVVGEILEIQDKDAIIRFGTLKSSMKVDKLDKISNNSLKKEKRRTVVVGNTTNEEIRQRKLNFRQDIDVRGMRANEALQAVTYFIDDALVVCVGQVRILHGTGTGALRQTIRQYLATIPGVLRCRDEHVQLGGAGITVVEF